MFGIFYDEDTNGEQGEDDLNYAYVFIPSENPSSSPHWRCVQDCVWKGPAWYEHEPQLSSIPGYGKLQELFVEMLEISDAQGWHFVQYLQALSQQKTINSKELDTIKSIYNSLPSEFSGDPPAIDRLR
jgi:hypothetical protein